jgi:GNAT superfamily N-acetyltransferase
MAAIEERAIVTLGPDDAGSALLLSTEAHWNQNEADWRFFLKSGTVFGIRDDRRRLVATSALLPYGSGNAWISMVLVTADCRRRGLATRLVDACLEAATKQRLTAWLDATPAGARVYGPLGFAPTLELRRLRLENSTPARIAAPQPSSDELAPFIARDRRGMGFERSALLTELGGRSGSRLVSDGDAVALVRDGRTARHIGPLFSDGPKATDRALSLVDAIARSESGPLLIDVVATRAEFLTGLTDAGWRIERPFQRMRFGRATTEATKPSFAVAGPEYG